VAKKRGDQPLVGTLADMPEVIGMRSDYEPEDLTDRKRGIRNKLRLAPLAGRIGEARQACPEGPDEHRLIGRAIPRQSLNRPPHKPSR